jgi:hypothetical protein
MKITDFLRLEIRKVITETFEAIEGEKVSIEPIKKSEIDFILNSCDRNMQIPHFDKACSDKVAGNRLQTIADWKSSIKLVKNGSVIGFYIFSKQQPIDFIEMVKDYGIYFNILDKKLFNEINTKKGVEGLALGINKEERGSGYGRTLMEYPKKMGYEYIWGIQTKGLSDIEKWTKRRKIVANAKTPDGQEFWITVEIF